MSQTPQPSAASIVLRDRRNRQLKRRRRLIAAGVVVGVLVCGFFVLPPIVKAQAVKRLSAELKREVSIEKLRLNPLVLSVTIDGLTITDRDGGAFTSWKRLYVNFDSFSLFTGEWRFQEIALEGFAQRVVIAKDGAFNFADLIPPPAPPSAEPAKSPRPIRIAQLSVTSAALAFSDASREQPFATNVGPLTFTLQNFLTTGDPKAPYEFSAITEAGETFTWRGTVSVDPVRSAGEFTLGKIALKKYAPYYADFINADLLGGSLDVNARYAIDLSPATRELTLNNAAIKLTGLQVAARGATTPLIDLPSLSIEGLSADGLKTSASIARIALDGGRVSVVREKDGSLNLLALLKPPATKPAPPSVNAAPASPAAKPALPDVKLAEFALSGLAIDLEDRTPTTPAKNSIGRLDISVKNLSLAEPAVPVLLKLSAATLPAGTLTIEGTATREPLTAALAVNLESLPLAGATPYIEPMLNLRVAGGAVSLDGFARLTGTVADFQGNVTIDQFATVDGAKGEDFVKFTKLSIRGIQALSEPLTANIAEITLTDPLARVAVHADKTTNLSTILRNDAASATPSAAVPPPTVALHVNAAAAPEPIWSLGKFTLANGGVVFSDRSVKPAARLSLDQFSGTVTGLSSADKKRADVNLRGKMNNGGAISLTGKLDAKAATRAPGALTELIVDIKGVDLAPISPYIGTYAGYELARSGLAVDVKARLAQRKIDTTNVVTLQQFTLGAPTNSPEATKLPVRLGIALMKDVDGNIVIDLPVKGDLDDPEFKIGRIVVRVLTNLLAKAATSPFSLIGAAFGGGGDELAYQEFAPGVTTPGESELKKIETLRKALKNRPALNLDITGSHDPEADLTALRDKTLAKQVRFRLWEERRRQDPNTPPPAETVVAPEDELRIIGLFMAERYPGGVPAVASDGSVQAPTPLFVPLPTTQEPRKSAPRGPVIRRTQRVFAGTPAKSAPAPAPETKPAPVAPVMLAPAGTAAGATPDGAPALTIDAARRALASGIPVSEDDLRQLAVDRAERVREAILAGGEIAAERVFITPPAPEGKGARVFVQLR